MWAGEKKVENKMWHQIFLSLAVHFSGRACVRALDTIFYIQICENVHFTNEKKNIFIWCALCDTGIYVKCWDMQYVIHKRRCLNENRTATLEYATISHIKEWKRRNPKKKWNKNVNSKHSSTFHWETDIFTCKRSDTFSWSIEHIEHVHPSQSVGRSKHQYAHFVVTVQKSSK